VQQIRKQLHLWTTVLASRVVSVFRLVRNKHWPVIIIWVVPYLLYIPLFISVEIQHYYTDIKYLWFIVGPKAHAFLTLSLICYYRKKKLAKDLIYQGASWFVIIAVLDIFATDNQRLYDNYIITLILYTFVSVLIIIKRQWITLTRE
jgi:FtsH-binding integral membrane protein